MNTKYPVKTPKYPDLKQYIEILLKDGKRSEHEDFQLLFRVFGKDKIAGYAKEILAKLKEQDHEGD